MKKKMFVSILNFLSFVFMITINALANILPINGFNTGQLSDMYPNLFVPAGITFSIWGLIYISLMLFLYGLYKLKTTDESNFYRVSFLFIISNFLNSSWILAWHYQFVMLSLVIMLALLVTLISMYLTVKLIAVNKNKSKSFLKFATSLYLGWISVATVANVSAFLVNIGWNRFGFSEVFWTISMIIIVALLTMVVLLKEKDIVFPLVILWAYLGIIIKRLSATPIYNEIIIITEISMVLIVLLLILNILKSKKINFKK